MKFSELLPIGTVVILKEAKKRMMIFGIGQTDSATNIDYDYIGVLYPEGNMGEGSHFLFNHSDIEEIFYKGYEDEERTKFLSAVEKMMENKKNNS